MLLLQGEKNEKDCNLNRISFGDDARLTSIGEKFHSVREAVERAGSMSRIFLAVVGVLLAASRIFWAFRGRVLARRLQSSDRELHPRKEEVIQALKIGLIVSFVEMLLALIASEVSAIAILSQS